MFFGSEYIKKSWNWRVRLGYVNPFVDCSQKSKIWFKVLTCKFAILRKNRKELVKGPTLICSFFHEICRFIEFFLKIPEPFFEIF